MSQIHYKKECHHSSMKLFHIFLLTISMLSVLSSCHKKESEYLPPVFTDIQDAEVTIIGGPDIIYPPTWSMQIEDSSVLILGLMDDHWIQIYNRFSGEPAGAHITRGEGPEEMIYANKSVFVTDDKYYKTFDEATQKIKFYDKKFNLIDQLSPKDFDRGRILDVFFLPGDRYLLHCAVDKHPSALTVVRNGEEGAMYTATPVDTPSDSVTDRNTPTLKDQYLRKRSAISSDGTRLVCTTLSGAFMEIFDINGLTLTPKVTKCMYPYEVETRGNLRRVTDDSTLGFSAVCATDSRIIGAFLEHTDLMGPSDITVWDWDGNPLRRYKTDYQISAMTLSPDNPDDIYAIGGIKDGEISLLLFHCPGLQD